MRIKLVRHFLSGSLGGTAACRARNAVQIQRKSGRKWETLKRLKTDATGAFRLRVSLPAVYRAVAPARPGCGTATSNRIIGK
jgi:hypothetical protein